MDLNKKKILITGGAGFIGSNLTLACQRIFPEAEIFVLDDFSSGHYQNLWGFKGDIIATNIVDFNLAKNLPKIDIVFHQAALTDTILAREKHQRVIYENVQGFRNVLNHCLSHGVHLVYASSGAAYGNSPPPMRVGKKEFPVNAYGFSKLIQDNIAKKYLDLFAKKNLKLVGLRYFIVYGPREIHKITDKRGSLIWKLYSKMKEGQRPVVFDNGNQKRDFVYIKDVIRANLLSLETKENGIFNVGTGRPVSVNEVVNILNKFLGTNLQPDYQENPFKGSYQYHTQADLAREEKILNYKPWYDLEQGIKDYLTPKN